MEDATKYTGAVANATSAENDAKAAAAAEKAKQVNVSTPGIGLIIAGGILLGLVLRAKKWI
jgi:hypothetical protein